MKILVVFTATLALVSAKPTVVHYTSPLQKLFVNQDASGGYSFGYTGDTSSKSESRTSDGSTKGTYSYVDANGIVQQVSYEADDAGGFRVSASNLPVAGPAEAAAAAAASATPYTGPVYKGPKANHQLGVPPPDTPEVAAAKAEHLAALAAAEAAASGSGSIVPASRYGTAGAGGLSRLSGTSGISSGFGSSGISGYGAGASRYSPGASGYSAGTSGYSTGASGYSAGASRYSPGASGYSAGTSAYSTGASGYSAGTSAGGYKGPKANHQLGVPPQDTPEVTAARAEHLAAVAAVASRDQSAANFGSGSLAGFGAGIGSGAGYGSSSFGPQTYSAQGYSGVPGAGIGAGARFGAGTGAGAGAGYGSSSFGAQTYASQGYSGASGAVGGYQGPKANHVLGQPPMDTPEVTEARKHHLILKAQVEDRDKAVGAGSAFAATSGFGSGLASVSSLGSGVSGVYSAPAFGAGAVSGARFGSSLSTLGASGFGATGYSAPTFSSQSRFGAQSAYATSSVNKQDPGVIAPSVPVGDTPEVAAEKERHFALVEQAKIASLNAIDDSNQYDDGSYKGSPSDAEGQYKETSGVESGAYLGPGPFDDGSYKGEGLVAGAVLPGSSRNIAPASTSFIGGVGGSSGFSASAYASGSGSRAVGSYSSGGRAGITPAATTLVSGGGASGSFSISAPGSQGISYAYSSPAISKTYLPPAVSPSAGY